MGNIKIYLLSICFLLGVIVGELASINSHLKTIQASTIGTDNISHSIEAQLEFMSEDVSVGPHSLIIK